MKRCPNCDIQYSDAEMFCSKCAAELEQIPNRRGTNGRDSSIDLRKKDKTSGANSDVYGSFGKEMDVFAGESLVAAQASFQAGDFSACIRQLEKAMESGVTGARRMYGCFLDDSEAFRRAVERHRYSDRISSSSFASSSPSSVRTEQASAKSAAPSGGSSSGSSSTEVPAGASSSVPADLESIFQEGKAAFERGQYDSAFQSFRRAATENHAMAQFYLGECYSGGKGVQKDTEKAAKWYSLAVMQFESSGAGQDDAEVLHCLGSCYENGKGVKRNSEKAVRYYIRAGRQCRRAAEGGDADAMYRLGSFCENGVGIEKNEVEAVKWYLKAMQQYRAAAEQGDAAAQFKLGGCYDEGKGVDENKAEAVKWYRMAAEQGHDGAQLKLGDCLYYGRGLKKNKAEAVRWYHRAEEQGNAFAGKRLSAIARKKRLATVIWILLLLILAAAVIWGFRFTGVLQLFDAGTSQDKGISDDTCKTVLDNPSAKTDDAEEKQKPDESAAQDNNVDNPQLDTAVNSPSAKQDDAEEKHKPDESVAQDNIVDNPQLDAAVNSPSAKQDDAEAKQKLDEKIAQDKDVQEKNLPNETIEQFRQEAGEGNAEAQYNLGVCYEKGKGVEKDLTEAFKWYQMAANQGVAAAQYALGVCYFNGKGVGKDLTEASKWYQKAADQGYVAAIDLNVSVRPRDITVGMRGYVEISAENGHLDLHQKPAPVSGIEWGSGISSGSSMSIIKGVVSSKYTLRVPFTAREEGEFTIPALEVIVNGNSRQPEKTAPFKIKVSAMPQLDPSQANGGEPVYVRMSIPGHDDDKPASFWVGEEIPHKLSIFVRKPYDLRITNYPEITPANSEMSIRFHDFSKINPEASNFESVSSYNQRLGNIPYTVYDFDSKFRALSAGQLQLVSELEAILLDENDFFSAFTSARRMLHGTSPTITIKPLPAAPADAPFSGLVGKWEIEASLSPGPYRIFEPLSLEINFSGEDQTDMLNMPKIEPANMFSGNAPETKETPFGVAVNYVLLPIEQGKQTITFSCSTFDPATGKYVPFRFKKTIQVD